MTRVCLAAGLLAAASLASAQTIPVASWEQARELLAAGDHHAVVWHLRQGNLRPAAGDPVQQWIAGAAYFDAAVPLALRELSGGALSDEAGSLLRSAREHLEALPSGSGLGPIADPALVTGAVDTRLRVLAAIEREAQILAASGAAGAAVAPIVRDELAASVRPDGAIARAVLVDLTRIREGILADARAIDAVEGELANFQKRVAELRDAIRAARVRFASMLEAGDDGATRAQRLTRKLAELDAELARFEAVSAGGALANPGAAEWPAPDPEGFSPLEVLQGLAGPAPQRVLAARAQAQQIAREAGAEPAGAPLAPGLWELVRDEFDYARGEELRARLDELDALLREAGSAAPGATP